MKMKLAISALLSLSITQTAWAGGVGLEQSPIGLLAIGAVFIVYLIAPKLIGRARLEDQEPHSEDEEQEIGPDLNSDSNPATPRGSFQASSVIRPEIVPELVVVPAQERKSDFVTRMQTLQVNSNTHSVILPGSKEVEHLERATQVGQRAPGSVTLPEAAQLFWKRLKRN